MQRALKSAKVGLAIFYADGLAYWNSRGHPELAFTEANLTKEKLVEKIKELLKTDFDLYFLLELQLEEIETLIACIRDRLARIDSDSSF